MQVYVLQASNARTLWTLQGYQLPNVQLQLFLLGHAATDQREARSTRLNGLKASRRISFNHLQDGQNSFALRVEKWQLNSML